jgi:hypothetical protein
MNVHPIARRIILISTILLLIMIAWVSITGGMSQIPQSQTIGEKAETILQLACGLLSLVTAITCFTWTRIRRTIRIAWSISLALSAGMSSVVWGPPMISVGVVFAVAALFVSLIIIKLLQVGRA